MECDAPFGGKVIVFGGDMRQILPVIPRAPEVEVAASTLMNAAVESCFRV